MRRTGPTALRTWRRTTAAIIVGLMAVLGVAGCGADGGSSGAHNTPSADREYSAARIAPEPMVGDAELPDLTHNGELRSLTPESGHLMIVYFGYTSCPDFCPRTLSDLAAARNRLADPTLIEPAMVTVDPERDLEHLIDYVHSFFDDGLALGSTDPDALARAAAPFGVIYSVDPNPDAVDDPTAEPVIVSHTTSLYAVDDRGRLVMTWPFGTTISDLAADIDQYLAFDYGTASKATSP